MTGRIDISSIAARRQIRGLSRGAWWWCGESSSIDCSLILRRLLRRLLRRVSRRRRVRGLTSSQQ